MANEKSVFKYLVCPTAGCGYKKTDTTGKAKGQCKNCNTTMYLSANWYARITNNGKTTVKSISPRKRDAEDYISTCNVAKRTGNLMPGEELDVTWATAVENCEKWWEQDLASNNIKQTTVDFYKYMLIALEKAFAGRSLLTITKEMVGDFVSQRQQEVSSTTTSLELRTLKRIYSLHIERMEMEERPRLMAKAMIISKIKPPRVDNVIDRFCETTEVKDVFKMIALNHNTSDANKARTKLGVMMGVGLGMRPGNICGLEWKEIDFKAGVIAIDGAKMKNHNDFVTGLPESIKLELQAWRKQQKVLSRFVFPSPLDPRKPILNMRTAINRAIKLAGLNPKGVERKHKVTAYVLTRHTYASQALMESGDLSAVSEQLHHSNVSITKKRYAKVNIGYKKDKINEYEATVLNRMME